MLQCGLSMGWMKLQHFPFQSKKFIKMFKFVWLLLNVVYEDKTVREKSGRTEAGSL